MQQEIKSQQELNAERETKISVLQEEMRKISELFTDTQQELEERCMELEEKDTELRKTNCRLKETKHTLRTTALEEIKLNTLLMSTAKLKIVCILRRQLYSML